MKEVSSPKPRKRMVFVSKTVNQTLLKLTDLNHKTAERDQDCSENEESSEGPCERSEFARKRRNVISSTLVEAATGELE